VNVGSLFAGIGGFDLGLERAGFRIGWQVEINPFCRAVLAHRFPDARRFEDVRRVGAADLPPVDLLCGGFPCQDLSTAGNGAGIDGARSGLWSEFARIVRELGPRYVLVENVPALLTGKGKRWDRAPIGRVLGDLAELGYDAEWACLSAREFGAPHLRKRVWIVAYPQGDEQSEQPQGNNAIATLGGTWAGAGGRDQRRDRPPRGGAAGGDQVPSRPSSLADGHGRRRPQGLCPAAGAGQRAAQADALGSRQRGGDHGAHWATEPDVGRVADGVPHRVDRLAALGNALLPQIAEWIGGRILEYEATTMSNWRRGSG
jgi:DNA (cytosine-5)-methyltransferase 1